MDKKSDQTISGSESNGQDSKMVWKKPCVNKHYWNSDDHKGDNHYFRNSSFAPLRATIYKCPETTNQHF